MGEAPSSGRGAGEAGALECIADTVNRFFMERPWGGYRDPSIDRMNLAE
jgi:hypothetical protein